MIDHDKLLTSLLKGHKTWMLLAVMPLHKAKYVRSCSYDTCTGTVLKERTNAIDLVLERMGNSQSADISEQEAASISKLTGFTKSQIQKIYHRYAQYLDHTLWFRGQVTSGITPSPIGFSRARSKMSNVVKLYLKICSTWPWIKEFSESRWFTCNTRICCEPACRKNCWFIYANWKRIEMQFRWILFHVSSFPAY